MEKAAMANYTRQLDLSCMPLGKKYRGHFEIIALMLEAVKYHGATRFAIMQHAGINCVQLKKYMRILTEIGFIEADYLMNGRVMHRTSDKGLDFLRQYDVLLGMLSGTHASKPISVPYEMPVIAK